ncbi:hypothetical protein [Halomonas huangheensis]|uniref:Uncharacterized protein n=1 Tax=Halomonas huangheensis TaxID=1178482 RepID=W1NAK3_9GAMM|nr:hypothetical protein [Halomonas huangheensis]ALM54061.1 hypothetical protein AR456_18605 [Halomonas huangheensis]ERL52554.1 hypothetical protein BJB45_08355 [Halomonas huangheensis]
MAVEYGVRPAGMSDEEWTLECQARMVVRQYLEFPGKKGEIIERWSKLPGVTPERLAKAEKELRS